MSLRQLLTILRARLPLALLVIVLCTGIATALSFLLPKQYTASASVVVDVKSTDPIAGILAPALTMPSYMATQVDILESERVAQRVVRFLRMPESPQMRAQWQDETQSQGDFESWLAQLLLRKLDIRPARESNVIQVNFTSVDAKFAAAVANAFVQAYLDTTVELRVDPARRYSSMFEERGKKLREDLEKLQEKLSSFQKRNGIIATDERIDVETQRMNELSSQLVTLQTSSADSRSRQVAANEAADSLQDVISNPVVSGLRADLTRQESKLQEVSERYGPSHPSIIELKANIDGLRGKLEQETQRLSTSVGVTSIIYASREAQVRKSLEAQREKVLRMKALRDELLVLERDVENGQKAYDGVMQRLNLASLESVATQTNAMLLMSATQPSKPSSPKPVLLIPLGLAVGLLAALAAVLAREAADRRVRSHEDVARELRLPVLGALRPARAAGVARGLVKPLRRLGVLARLRQWLRAPQPGSAA
jgi:polysaccharide biosynthesis transport protein